MLIGDRPPTEADLNFRLFGIPVRVHPMFWLVSLVIGMSWPTQQLVMWIPVVFISILVHELGHALVIRQFGGRTSILLYYFGGLAMGESARSDPRKRILILLAGPGAGFALAAVIVLLLDATHHRVSFRFGPPWGIDWGVENAADLSRNVQILIGFFLFANIWWGLINLLPVFPLDGGQICGETLSLWRVPDAMIKSLVISTIVAGAVALYALRLQELYMALMFGYLGYSSFSTMQAYTGRGGGYGGW